MELLPEAVFEFLDLFENEPAIWNPKHQLHRNRNEVRDAWNRIQDSFSIKCTVDELKKKRDSLMATFRPLLVKVKKSTKSGTSSDAVYKPNWFAYDRMAKFLVPVYQPRTTKNTEETEDIDVEGEEEDDGAEESATATEETAPADDAVNPNVVADKPTMKGGRKRQLTNMKAIETQMTDAYKIMKTVAAKKKVDKDACSVYTELLAMKLREFDDFNRTTLMNEIDNLVYRAKIKVLAQQRPPQSSYYQQFPFSTTPLHIHSPSASPSPSNSSTHSYAGYHSPSESRYSPYSLGHDPSTSQQSQLEQYTEYPQSS